MMLVALLLVGLVAQLGIEAASDSATFDEPVYVDAGQQLFHGKLLNLEHPPLAKVAFGAATAVFAPSRPSKEGTARQLWLLGPALTVARWVNIVLAILIAILVVVWSLETGKVAAFGALVVLAFDPTLIAHAHLATLDVPNAVTVGVSCYCAERLDAHPSWQRFCWLALTIGLAFLTKWSAFVLIPALPLAAALASLAHRRGLGTAIRRALLQVLALAVGIGLMLLAYAVFWKLGDLKAGLLFQVNHENAGHEGFLFGKVSSNPAWYYFIAALVLKSPLALLPLVLVGAYAARRRTFLWVPPLLVLVLTSAGSVKIGIRYLLPAYVMLYVLAGIGVQHLWSSRHQWLRFATVGLLVSYVASSLAAFPAHLAYFNELAVASAWQGQDWLNDSNADWGQGLKTLRHDLAARNIREICLEYQGPSYVSPQMMEFYLGSVRIVPPGSCRYAAVSSFFLVTEPANVPLRHRRPLNTGPIYIFDLQAAGTGR
jgi:hypothetical protein